MHDWLASLQNITLFMLHTGGGTSSHTLTMHSHAHSCSKLPLHLDRTLGADMKISEQLLVCNYLEALEFTASGWVQRYHYISLTYLLPDVTLVQGVSFFVLLLLVKSKPLIIRQETESTVRHTRMNFLTSLSLGSTIVSFKNLTRTRLEMLERRSLYSCLKVWKSNNW